jgi:hypothetical protein
MRVGVGGVEGDGSAVADERVFVPAQVVVDVPEIEVRFEAVRIEADRALVERLRLDELVARVVDVRQVHDRGDQLRIDDERLPVRRRSLLHVLRLPVVQT